MGVEAARRLDRPLPRRRLPTAIQVSGVKAPEPQASAVHTES